MCGRGATALEEDIPGETLAQLVAEEAPSAKYIQVSVTTPRFLDPNHPLSRSSDGGGEVVKETRLFSFWSSDIVHCFVVEILINVQPIS